ncbi:MAG: hypothetical protein QOD28_296 [Acidobacteriota bacterium]|nr:hypothetical protein [Acidobacteriota bacterium]
MWKNMRGLSRVTRLMMVVCCATATIATMATVTMFIPLAASLDPSPSTAILIAVAAS